MYRRFLRTIAALLLTVSLALPAMTMSASAGKAADIVRIGGESRVETAALIAGKGWNNCGTVLLANAYSFPDALAGVPLAGALGAPILLTKNGDSLESDVRDRLNRLGVRYVYILGGTTAVSDDIAAQLRSMGCSITRLAGNDRFATAVAIARKLIALSGQTPDDLFFASSANYPDALAAGSAASAMGSPILYVRPDGSLDSTTAQFVAELSERGLSSGTILGGTSAVADDAVGRLSKLGLSDIRRLSGSDRYATALAINTACSDVLDSDTIVAATGTAFPDALAGGALAAFNNAPIVLLPAKTGNAAVAEYISDCSPSTVYVLGGEKAVSSEVVDGYFARSSASTPTVSADEEMRAVWIPYLSQTNINAAAIDQMVADCLDIGANAIIFHVRPFGDAVYDSDIFPWSHVFTGVQGEGPSDGFDPLEYIVEQAHANDIELHAWINPLRIQLANGSLPRAISADNPYTIWRTDDDPANDDWVIDYQKGKFYNPAYPEVRQMLIDGMVELVRNYDIDGIHWDDYFYPAADASFDDSLTYTAYTGAGGTMTLIEWRSENINALVRDSYAAVKAVDPDCDFGISPQGNIGNCTRAGADVYEWCSTPGYIDYICPQIYWTFDNTISPFAVRCDQWREITTCDSVKLYIGLALYKAGGTADSGKWQKSDRDIAGQIEYVRGNGINADGFMLYSYQFLNTAGWEGEVSAIRELLATG